MNSPLSMTIRISRKAKKISLTPLIDVVFILLLFFMLTSQFKRWQFFEIFNSESSANTVENPNEQPIFLLLHSSGKLTTWPTNKSWESVNALTSEDMVAFTSKERLPKALLIPDFETRLQTILTTTEHLEKLGFLVSLSEPVEKHDE